MHDEIEARVARANPVPPDALVDRADSPRAAILRRKIMSANGDVATTESPARSGGPSGWRRPLAVVAGAAVLTGAVAGGVMLWAGDQGGTTDDAGGPPDDATSMTMQLPANDAMGMCLPVADFQPEAGTVAFLGVVTAVAANDDATLAVERWYAGGDADQVVLQGTQQSMATDYSVDLAEGGRYLVSAVDSTVLACGVSGPASAELEQLYDEWYG